MDERYAYRDATDSLRSQMMRIQIVYAYEKGRIEVTNSGTKVTAQHLLSFIISKVALIIHNFFLNGRTAFQMSLLLRR